MRLTKNGHACVRLEDDERTLVIDPGTLTEAEALEGASPRRPRSGAPTSAAWLRASTST